MKIGHRLANLRERKGLSQSALADLLGRSQSSVAMWETNKRRVPEEVLNQLADLYGVSLDYIMGRDVPKWASEEDVVDLEEMLNSNVNMSFGGENLTEEEKQRVRDVLTGIFWEKLEKQKRRGAGE
ncbi:helix-turn-helix domain-containing protein [Atopococcus tabaci]|uniref:helix-turn-helix domain-containing protein n=1 Tax=Atopococcus tabaci TaxID=269774 RepID=UPI00240963A9|nr:helix-turn-helix transcriptional regulator [Atopococcus tabaci]